MKLLAPILLVALLMVACRRQGNPTLDADSLDPAARHAVHDRLLKGLMERFAMLPAERLPQELDVAREQDWRREDAVRILGDMARSAEAIPAVLKDADLSAAQREAFEGFAVALTRDADALAKDAPNLAPFEIRRRFDALQVHCDACHRRFRVLPALE